MREETPRRLLNPFSFPSETQLRSILLIWAILGLCWGVGFYFAKVLALHAGWQAIGTVPKLDRNILRIDRDDAWVVPSPDDLAAWYTRMAAADQELAEPGRLAQTQTAIAGLSRAAQFRLQAVLPYFLIPFLFLILALLCILVLYGIRVCRLRLSGRSSLIGEKPEFQSALQGLVKEAQELQRSRGERPMPQPRFLLSRGALGDGQVFGSSKYPSILLTRAMPLILRRDVRQHGKPYLVRAAVLHELAHLANRDITRSYWAEASWAILFPVLFLLMATLWLLLPSLQAQDRLPVGVQVVAVLIVVELIRRGILRHREYEADLRASLLWSAGEPLRESLVEDKKNPGGPGRLWSLLARLWRKHPTGSERRDALDHPDRALLLNMDVPFLAGLLFGNLVGSILSLTAVIVLATDALGVLMTHSIIERIIQSRGPAIALRLYYPIGWVVWGALMFVSCVVLLCVVSYFLAGTLGMQTQRESLLQLAEAARNPSPYRSLLKPAFLTAVGFELGLLLLPLTLAFPGQALGFLGVIAWVLLATLTFWGWLSAIRFFARRLLGTHLARRSPQRQLRLVTWASTILLWPLILILLGGQFWIWPSMQSANGWAALAMGSLGLVGFFCILALMFYSVALREVRREERRPRCPQCGAEVSSMSVAAHCGACGNSLAPWLFIEVPAALEAGAT